MRRVESDLLDFLFCDHSIYTLDEKSPYQYVFKAKASSKRHYVSLYMHKDTRRLVLVRRVASSRYVVLTKHSKTEMHQRALMRNFKYIKQNNKPPYKKLKLYLIKEYYPEDGSEEYIYSVVPNINDCIVLSEEKEELLKIKDPSNRRGSMFRI